MFSINCELIATFVISEVKLRIVSYVNLEFSLPSCLRETCRSHPKLFVTC
jgi:hypothetical protein